MMTAFNKAGVFRDDMLGELLAAYGRYPEAVPGVSALMRRGAHRWEGIRDHRRGEWPLPDACRFRGHRRGRRNCDRRHLGGVNGVLPEHCWPDLSGGTGSQRDRNGAALIGRDRGKRLTRAR